MKPSETEVTRIKEVAGELALMLWEAIPPNEQSNKIDQLKAENDTLRKKEKSHMIERDRLRGRIWELIRIGHKQRDQNNDLWRFLREHGIVPQIVPKAKGEPQ